MKILLIHPHDIFDPHEPWTIRIESIARELKNFGHEVKLIHFLRETSIEKYTTHPFGFEVISLKRRGGWGLFKQTMREVLHEMKWADIVHFQKCFHYVSIPVIIGARLFDKPVHYDWDDNEEAIYKNSAHPPRRFIHFFIKTFERVLPKLVDTVSVASHGLKKKCLDLGLREECLYDAPVGADLHRFGFHVDGSRIKNRFNKNGKIVLYLGQLNGAQYTTLFVEAVKKLKEKHTDTVFLIIGSGCKFKAIQRYARRLGVLDTIRFTGSIRHESVPEYLAAADITVACFEDNEITRCKSPLKVVEYLAAGKAIVASAVGEVRVMLNDCGVLVRPGSSDSLAEGVDRLLSDESLRKDIQMKARGRAEEVYNWTRVSRNLERAYKAACKDHSLGKDIVSDKMLHPTKMMPLCEEVAL